MEAAIKAATIGWSEEDFDSRPGFVSILEKLKAKSKDCLSSEAKKRLAKVRAEMRANQERWLQASILKYALKDVKHLAQDPLMESEPKWSEDFMAQLRSTQRAVLLSETSMAAICGPIKRIEVSKDFMDALHRSLHHQLLLYTSKIRQHVGQASPRLDLAIELKRSEVEELQDSNLELRLRKAQCVLQYEKELQSLLDQWDATPVLSKLGIGVLRDQVRLLSHHVAMKRALIDEKTQLYTPSLRRLFEKIELQLDRQINETRLGIHRDKERLDAFREAWCPEMKDLLDEYRAANRDLQCIRRGLQCCTK
ncbi:uncharacterized protein LOC144161941 [Haemaphysalis longicornis]